MSLVYVLQELPADWVQDRVSDNEYLIVNKSNPSMKVSVRCEPADGVFRADTDSECTTQGSFRVGGSSWKLELYGNCCDNVCTYFYTVVETVRIVVKFTATTQVEFEVVQREAKGFVKLLKPEKYFTNKLILGDHVVSFCNWKRKECTEVIKLVADDIFCNITASDELNASRFNAKVHEFLEYACTSTISSSLEYRLSEEGFEYALYRVVDGEKEDFLQCMYRWGFVFLAYGSRLDLIESFREEEDNV